MGSGRAEVVRKIPGPDLFHKFQDEPEPAIPSYFRERAVEVCNSWPGLLFTLYTVD